MFDVVRRELAKTTADRIVAIVWVGLLVGLLANSALNGSYIADSHGRPVPGDFLAFWSAGQLFASGQAAAAYDPEILRHIQAQDIGHPIADYYPWVYPPLFLFVAILLAQFPYAVAYVLWAIATLIGYGACAKALFRDRGAAIAFGAAPACFGAFIIAQNGLFTAALFGAALLTLTKRPILSGLLLAALAYKPQFGVLFPIALIAGGHWRTILVATLATAAWMLVWLVIDKAVFSGFVNALAFASHNYLAVGMGGWHKLQSIYGLLLTLGMGEGWASTVHGIIAACCIVVVAVAWRSPMSFSMKSAIIALCSLIVTPYSYIYDFPILTIAVGFLYRDRPFDRVEQLAVLSAYALVAAYLFTGIPLGTAAVALIAMLVARRIPRSQWRRYPGAVGRV